MNLLYAGVCQLIPFAGPMVLTGWLIEALVPRFPMTVTMDVSRQRLPQALEATAFKQGLTPRRMSMSELFVDPRA